MSEPHWIGLADAVRGVRAELRAAMAEGEGEQVRFDVDEVEMEFAVEVRRDERAEGGIRVWVASVGVSGGESSATTHRLRVTLSATDMATGGSPRIADRRQEGGMPPR
jgi:NTP-dependent ternary system trypsin peptidase co-occuring protein